MLIAVVNSVDIVVALNNLLRVPSSIVIADEPGGSGGSQMDIGFDSTQAHAEELSVIQGGDNTQQSFPTGMRFKTAVCCRLIEGALAISASFILIVQSDEIIEMIINFAALVFVVHMDNLAFALAEHGLLADSLQEAARFVGGLRFRYVDYDAWALKENRQGCTSNAGRLAAMRGNAMKCLFATPLKWSQQNPKKVRKCTLIMMTLSLWAAWFLILSSLRTGDFLPKSIEVEFFHGCVTASSSADGGLKPFIASRSGTYVSLFVDDRQSFEDTMVNMATGRFRSLVVAYRKIDPKAYPPPLLNQAVIVPADHQEILYYNPETHTWIFATCDLDRIELMNIISDVHSACTGPAIHSIETDIMDITKLSTSTFRVVSTNAQEIELPANISNNECGNQYAGVRGSARADCGSGGGQCSDPQIDSGLRRTCICPQGVYGPFCTDFYAQLCPSLNFRFDETVTDVPLAAGRCGCGVRTAKQFTNSHMTKPTTSTVQLDSWDARGFSLLREEVGVNNSPIWERRYMSKGFYDRIEQRSGAHWTLTRHHESKYGESVEFANVELIVAHFRKLSS